MAVDIGKKYLENLIETRALVRQIWEKHTIKDSPVFFLNKDGLIFSVQNSDRGTCYECCERIGEGRGILLKIEHTPNSDIDCFYFHKYHF